MTTDLAIWAITPNGIDLGRTLSRHFPGAALFLPEKEGALPGLAENSEIALFSNLKREIKHRFKGFQAHIFIFSTGIAVRMIAPLLESKTEDPAVVVMDEKGVHAISLVSGHLGGANELAIRAARATGGTPVITTATDINRLPSMDMIAKKIGLFIENPSAIKHANMRLLKGLPLRVEDPMGLVLPHLPDPLISLEHGKEPDVVCSWNRRKVPRETLQLRPRVLTVGIGCNRNTSMADMMEFLDNTFKQENLSMNSIAGLATTSVKRDEAGILALAKELDCPLHFYERDELNSVETIENPSEMAEKYLGVKSVCEAAAILGSKQGKLIVPKKKTGDVTLAVAMPK